MDRQQCRELAIKATGIDPDILEIKMRAIESMLGRASMPGLRGGLTQSPGRLSQMDDYGSKVKEIEREYDTYLKIFSEFMKERGYKVK